MPRTALHTRRSRTSCSILALATVMAVGATPAAAQSFLGTGTYTTNPNATGITTAPNTTTINLNGGQTIIDWVPTDNAMGGGNITFQNAGTTALFTGSSNFAVLNRINQADIGRAIIMNGTVNSRVSGVQGGSVYFYAPGGFIFGGSSVFSVGSLVVTTSPITLTGNNFINGAENTVVFGQAPNPNAFISSSGTISANSTGFGVLPPGSNYVAMVAPRVTHNGTITVNGSAALVAAEAATINFSPDGLFDIQVTVGTDDDAGVLVNGDIGGPAPTSGTDRQGVYLVAVPKNDALTMVIGNGADLGFTLAGSATIDNAGVVVLSAGHDITNGAIGAKSAAPGTGAANFWFTGAHATNNLFGEATGSAYLYSVAPNLTTTFDRNVTVHAAGNVSMSSSGAGASLTVGGNLSLSADRMGTAGQSVTAGNVSLFAQNGGTLSVAGTIDLSADAVGGDASSGSAGSGTGGNVTVSANDGSTLTLSSLTTSATGTGGSGLVAGVNAGSGTGGTLSMSANNGATLIMNSPLLLNAQGYGGSASGAGLAGNGTGGVARISVDNNATMTFNGAVTLDSDGFGGSHDTGTGGAGTGGWAYAHANGGSISVNGNLLASADGEGGSAQGGQGGDGFGTNAEITATLGGIVTVSGNVELSVTGTGGDGYFGGNGVGGGISDGMAGGTDGAHIFVKNGSVNVTGITTLDASGFGGDGANGGAGGDAEGGWTTIHARNTNDGTSSITLAAVNIRADATGGYGGQGTSGNQGGDGGTGGTATGGVVSVTANAGNGHITATTLSGSAIATGGAGGDGGNGDGLAGGNGGAGGDAQGGSVTVGTSSGGNGEALASNLGTATFTTVTMDSSAIGGRGGDGNFGATSGNGGNGGDAIGGASVLLVRGSTVNVEAATLTANATGGDAGFGYVPESGAPGTTGIGGDATIGGDDGGIAVIATGRFLIPAQRGTLNAGSIIGTAIASSGIGIPDGDSTSLGGSEVTFLNADGNIGSLDFQIGFGGQNTSASGIDMISVINGAVDVEGEFAFATPGNLSFLINNGSLTAGTIDLSAGNFVTDPVNAPPLNRGTAFADNVYVTSDGDFIADADFDVTNTFVVDVPGSIRVGSVTDDNGIDFTAGGSISIDGIDAGTYLFLFAVDDIDTDDILAGSSVDIESETGSISVGNIDANSFVSLVAGTFIAGEDISTGGSIFAQTFAGDIGLENLTSTFGSITLDADGNIDLSGDLLADGDIELTATGDIDMNHATAGESVDLQATGNILALNLTGGDSVEVEADGSVTVGDLSAGLVDPSTNVGSKYAVNIHAGGNILTGNIAAAQDINLATPGTMTTGDINAGGIFLALGHGDMSFGDAIAEEVFLADYAMFTAGQISANCIGTCGILGANGVVTAPPTGSSYSYVTTEGGVEGAGQLTGEGGTNGSFYTTGAFSAEAGDDLSFWFNFVTSDGSGFADYAWAALFTTSLDPVAILYTARTQPTGTIVPGLDLPGVEATLNPATVPIIGGAPVWDPLGTSSGSCYATGCGFTGWVNSTYAIANSGTYVLRFGVTNWLDTSYQSGMAFSGITVGGAPVSSSPLLTGGSITIGNVTTGNFTAAAGTNLTSGPIDAGGNVNLFAGAAINLQTVLAGSFHADAGTTFTAPNITSGSDIQINAGGSIVADDILAGTSVAIESETGSIGIGNIGAGGNVSLIAGTFIAGEDIVTSGHISAQTSSGDINLEFLAADDITMNSGDDILVTGAIDADGNVNLFADAAINLQTVLAGFFHAEAGTTFTAIDITSDSNIQIYAGGNVSLDDLSAGVTADEFSNKAIRIDTDGSVLVDDIVALGGIDITANGSVTGGDVTTGDGLFTEAGGAILYGNISAGLVNPQIPSEPFSVGLTSGASITVGNVNASQGIGFVALGTLTTANLTTNSDVLGLANGNMIIGNIDADGRVLLADSSMFSDAGGTIGVGDDDDVDIESIFAATPVRTGGSITVGNVLAGSFTAAAGTSLTTGLIQTDSGIGLDAGGAITTGNLSAGDFVLANGGSITTGNIDAGSVEMTSASGNITSGDIFAFGDVELDAFDDIATGDITAGSIDLLAGDDITTGDLTTQFLALSLGQEEPSIALLYPGASITLEAGDDISTGNIDSIDGVYVDAGGSISTGWIEAKDFVELIAVDDISSGYIDAGQYILVESGGNQALGNLSAGWDIGLEAGGNIAFGDADAGTEFDFEAGGNVSGGDIVAGIEIGGEGAGGNVVLGDLTAGFGEGEPEDVASIGFSAGGSITVGNVNSARSAGFATLGNLTTGNVNTGDDFLALASGNITTGSITTGAGDQVYMAHSSMCVTGGGCSDAETDFDPEIVFALDPVATGGSITINGPVNTGRFDAAAGTSLTTQAINAADDIHASAGGTATLNGVWNSGGDVNLASNDIDISNSGGINAADSVGLFSTNATQALIGDGLEGTGYQLSNAEFGRISGYDVFIGARGDATAAIDMLIGDLTVTGPLAGSTIEGADGILAFAVGDIDSETVSGVIRVVGDVNATGFGSDNAIEFHSSRFELDAATGSVSIVSSGSTLGGEIGLYADRIHVAEGSILDQLAANPTYTGYQEDLNEPATVQRPEGVLRADTLWIESDNLQDILIQNTGTDETPAGFLVHQAFINDDAQVAGPPGSINLVVNGQVVTDGGTLTGVEARDALTDGEDLTPFTSNSTINGCPLSGPCVAAPPPPPPTANLVDNQIDLFTGSPFGESDFDDNQEGDEGANSPISPPQPLFDTRPLTPDSDVNDPVSGTGNPALTSASECVDDDDDDETQCGTEKEGGQ